MNVLLRQLSLALTLFFLTTAPCWGGLVTSWSIRDISQAPVLIVGRVAKVTRGSELPEEEQKYPHRVENCFAEIDLLRVHTADDELRKGLQSAGRVRIAYHDYVLGYQGGITASLLWPQIKEGDVRVFPLRPEPEGSATMRLIAEEGIGILAPALVHDPDGVTAPNPYAFVLREIAAVLASGDPNAVLQGATYLREALSNNYTELVSPDSVTALVAMIDKLSGGDQSRYVELAAGLFASHGVPRPTLSEFAAKEFESASPRGATFRLTHRALSRIPEEIHHRQIIETLIRNTEVSSLYAWGAAATLAGFSDEPFLVSELAIALRKRQPGSLYVASWIIDKGQQAVLKEAILFALELIDPPDGDGNELFAACRILRDRGNNSDFEAMLAAIRKYQAIDLDRYQKLWNCAAYAEDNPREIEVLALYLPDTRVVFGNSRFRDLATARLQQLSGRDFGFQLEQAEAHREEAAVKATAWLAEQIRLGRVRLSGRR